MFEFLICWCDFCFISWILFIWLVSYYQKSINYGLLCEFMLLVCSKLVGFSKMRLLEYLTCTHRHFWRVERHRWEFYDGLFGIFDHKFCSFWLCEILKMGIKWGFELVFLICFVLLMLKIASLWILVIFTNFRLIFIDVCWVSILIMASFATLMLKIVFLMLLDLLLIDKYWVFDSWKHSWKWG